MIQIQVPATSANLGSGFDALGLALTLYNRVWMEEYDGILISSRDAVPIPTDASNLIFWAASRLYEECGRKMPGLRMIQENHIPMASGLGSSSACIVAGLLGANRLLGSPLGKSDLIHLAAKIEGHPDNTTPAISGGLVASAVEGERVYSISVPVSEKIRFAVFHPPFELKTEQARSVLPRQYSREDVVYNLSRSALMIASLFSGETENLRVAVQDKVHQPYRLGLIPDAETVFRLTYELGSLGTYISGAGPTIIAMIDSEVEASFAAQAMPHLESRGVRGWDLWILQTDSQGAVISLGTPME